MRPLHIFAWPFALLTLLSRLQVAFLAKRAMAMPLLDITSRKQAAVGAGPVGSFKRRHLPKLPKVAGETRDIDAKRALKPQSFAHANTPMPAHAESSASTLIPQGFSLGATAIPASTELNAQPEEPHSLQLHFDLDYQGTDHEDFKHQLLEHFREEHGMSEEALAQLHIEFREGSLIADIRTHPEAPDGFSALKGLHERTSQKEVTIKGVRAEKKVIQKPAVQTESSLAAASLEPAVQSKDQGSQGRCPAAAAVAAHSRELGERFKAQIREMRDEWEKRCRQLQDRCDELGSVVDAQAQRMQELDARSRAPSLQSVSTLFPVESPRQERRPDTPKSAAMPFAHHEEASAIQQDESVESTAANVARKILGSFRNDWEAQMRPIQIQSERVARELKEVKTAAAMARGRKLDESSKSLRQYLVEALILPVNRDETQQLALRVLRQAFDVATLLCMPGDTLGTNNQISELDQRYSSIHEAKEICSEVLAKYAQKLLAGNGQAPEDFLSSLSSEDNDQLNSAPPQRLSLAARRSSLKRVAGPCGNRRISRQQSKIRPKQQESPSTGFPASSIMSNTGASLPPSPSFSQTPISAFGSLSQSVAFSPSGMSPWPYMNNPSLERPTEPPSPVAAPADLW
eukprot:TRINITY_DN44365_c0_g1_i1.p1 TRINITY_DN44365_c0_g1~~TRINITY_DN44365_c0_g1_i1.p1  ORF type:complete len:720 (-),score=137.35 TRINITY_DN44365_c0_g1_i1:71-1963(-)